MYINIKSKLALWSPVLFLTGFISDICQGAAKIPIVKVSSAPPCLSKKQ